ncbi:glycosyltransferase family 4 protein [Embleya hyalina]|uniref:Glycosyl transferase family 1 n=1 Tax=Embleya hyalina TaxID=516124 RepID=A0A401YXE7_9ACTN|nr:glycosyltransferase family 4 protein [Embleya hyalina]GCD99294.1 glycosyl transferase family 1 [Embleya hyalina]
MRILVCPHDMQLGGSSINAVDLARAVRDLGHEVWVMGRQGPLRQRVAAAGLPLLALPERAHVRPSPAVSRAIAAAVRRHRIDVVHTYEYWPLVEAFLGAFVPRGTPVLGTIMSMGSLPPYFPRTGVPLTLGYGDLYEETGEVRGLEGARVHLLEPPVDTAIDHPVADGADAEVDVDAFAAEHGLLKPAPTVVLVSRLARHLKQEHLERTVDAVARLSPELPGLRLVLVGGGSIESELQARAAAANAELGRRAIVLTGEMADPRPAYALADVVVGMGSSALRGMAFGKPTVVVGEQGFSEPVTPETIDGFDGLGFYGLGTGRMPVEQDPLVGQLTALLGDEAERERIGAWSLDLVRERFALDSQALRLVDWYEQARADHPPARGRVGEAVRVGGRLVGFKAGQRGQALRRRTRGGRGASAQ